VKRVHASSFKQAFRSLAVLFVGFVAGTAQATEWTPYAKVSSTFVSSGTNMYFRVIGPVSTQCPDHSNWAYINESDSGAKGKIATLLTAYALGKNVRLFVEPKDFYGNGAVYCHVLEVQVTD
jgi:hypothetical protein